VFFAVIATIVYSAMNASISRVNIIKDGDMVFDMASGCLNRISMDLKAVYVDQYPLFTPPDYDDPPDPYAFVGDTDYAGGKSFSRLRFASFAHLPVSRGGAENSEAAAGLAQLRYYVQEGPDPDGGYILKRGDRPFPYDIDPNEPESQDDPVLCTNISELKFRFYDDPDNVTETWDSSGNEVRYATPKVVEIFFIIKTGQGEYPFFTRVFLPVSRERLQRVEE
jgi:general secretion pathway protein J